MSKGSHKTCSLTKKTGQSQCFERVLEFVVGDVGVDLGGGDLGVAEGFGYQRRMSRFSNG